MAQSLIPYFKKLGISDLYSSPLYCAKQGSIHGYDVVDFHLLNSEIGSEEELASLTSELKKNDMALMLDIVPNHMYIVDERNPCWINVLENGPASPYANYFDIDWHPIRSTFSNKVLLPILDKQFGECLELQEIKIFYERGCFKVSLPFINLPTDPKSWTIILEPIAKKASLQLPEDHPALVELHSIITAIVHLPLSTNTEAEKISERQREKEIIKHRLSNLLDNHSFLHSFFNEVLQELNGRKGVSNSFDSLETFLNIQPYHLSFWRVASDEINYRRFFDTVELAGLATEKSDVFNDSHALVFDLLEKGYIQSLRVDHIDGLWDPEQYLQDLQNRCREILKYTQNDKFPLIVEKILVGNEKLRPEWPVNGTVGYDFLNQLNGIYVYSKHKKEIVDAYFLFTDLKYNPLELTYTCKKLILLISLSSELIMLARRLDRIAEQHRYSRDFTLESLKSALREVIACFPVYRTYIRAAQNIIHNEDRHIILMAIVRAKKLNLVTDTSIFDFIQDVLLGQAPSGLNSQQKEERINFVMRFQQITGPIMAKGVEDTAFYRYFPLVSINEVGMDPYAFGMSVELFHKKNQERFEQWPLSMLATSTHDTKRSEDVRARINVLSEIPQEWQKAVQRWSAGNQKYKKVVDEEFAPSFNDEYLFYQTIVGSWPFSESLDYAKRIQAYMEKATKESKLNTSWINPNQAYDEALCNFVGSVLADSGFLTDLKTFLPKVVNAGMWNSLSQVLLKLTVPGVPDIYQGNEIWELRLVDPDNRYLIDFDLRQKLLSEVVSGFDQKWLREPQKGHLKMFLTYKTLQFRHQFSRLFAEGVYFPLEVEGEKAEHIIAFARILEDEICLVITSRFFSFLLGDNQFAIDKCVWKGTFVNLPTHISQTKFRNIFTDSVHAINSKIDLEEIFSVLPFAVLGTT